MRALILAYGLAGLLLLLFIASQATECGECVHHGGVAVETWYGAWECVEPRNYD